MSGPNGEDARVFLDESGTGAGIGVTLTGNCADPAPAPARKAALNNLAAALAELTGFFYAHPEYPLPTTINLWSHQHHTPVTAVDELCERVPDAVRYGDNRAVVTDLAPGYGLSVDYALLVYPDDQPMTGRVLGSSQP